MVDSGAGGGLVLGFSSSPQLIEGNVIRNNWAGYEGGGLLGGSDDLVEIRDNVIIGNYAHVCGGGLMVGPCRVIGNLIAGNLTDFSYGAGLCGFPLEVSNNTIASNTSGMDIGEPPAGTLISRNIVVSNQGFGLQCGGWKGSARLECNDVWGNGVDLETCGNLP